MEEKESFMREAIRLSIDNMRDGNGGPFGAVVVKDGRIIGAGANQAAIKNKYLAGWHKKYFCVRRWLKIKSGQKYWLCPGCARYRDHAERRAVKDGLARHSELVAGALLYLWGHWWCCEPCAAALAAAGIKDVYLLEGSDKLFK